MNHHFGKGNRKAAGLLLEGLLHQACLNCILSLAAHTLHSRLSYKLCHCVEPHLICQAEGVEIQVGAPQHKAAQSSSKGRRQRVQVEVSLAHL